MNASAPRPRPSHRFGLAIGAVVKSAGTRSLASPWIRAATTAEDDEKVTMGDIGPNRKEIELEPVEEPATEPATIPAPAAPSIEPDREPVPAP